MADNLLFNKGIPISRKVIIALYHKLNDEVCSSLNVRTLRSLRRSVAFPDHFSQQNVNDAKRVFEEETIAYQLQQLANDQEYDQSIFDGVMEDYSGKIGYSGEIL